ncbi:MAG: sigma-70 family RNA polymerase sigma factor [Saprospiraceae bacterium]|jgi:RNA polymerase sigma factor (sigma-70 family)|nr:sigma-70 family RNA polymerase sigma factor [Saprospiraceae bacterium]
MRLFSNKEKYQSENELILGCKNRDEKAYLVLYNRYSRTMMGICRRYMKVDMIAEEVLSNGFIKIFKNIDKYEAIGSFEGWMKKIMVRESLSYLRSKNNLQFATDDSIPLENQVFVHIQSDVDCEYLLKLIDDLPEGYKTVFNLYAIDGYTHQEIAAMLGIQETTSKTQLHRARIWLKKKLNQESSEYILESNKSLLL